MAHQPEDAAVTETTDPDFYNRADTLIHLANDQLKKIGRGKVSASFLYGASRFNAWVSACGFDSAEQMQNAKQQTVEYFVEQYQKMLEENIDDYIANFSGYMRNTP
jgi:hypothetical protein